MKKLFFYLLVVFLTLFTGYSASDVEYNYIINIDANLDEDETLICYITEDGSRDRETFDDNDKSKDFEFEGTFDDKIIVDCDDPVDEIRIRVLDEDDNEVYDKRFTNTKQARYELQLYEAVFELEHDFESGDTNITCTLKYDEQEEDFIFDPTNGNIDERIEKEFLNEVSLDCNEKIDEFSIKVDNPENKRVFTILTEQEDKLEYKTTFEDQTLQLEFYITDEFENYEDGDQLTCDFISDDEYTRTFRFDDSTRLSEKNDIVTFGKNIEMDCDDPLEEIHIVLTDTSGFGGKEVEFFEKTYKDISELTLNGEELFQKYTTEVLEKEAEKQQEEAAKKEAARKAFEERLKQQQEALKQQTSTSSETSVNTSTTSNQLTGNGDENIQDTNSSLENISTNQTTIVEEPTEPKPAPIGVFIIMVGLVLLIAILLLIKKK
jgi:hypothetical protein